MEEELLKLCEKIQSKKPLYVLHGKVHMNFREDDSGDSMMYIAGDPTIILFEFTRIKNIPVIDLFISFDTDNSHSISWDEFREGIKVCLLIGCFIRSKIFFLLFK